MVRVLRKMAGIRSEIGRGWYIGGAIFTFLIILLGWMILTSLRLVDPVFLPNPAEVLKQFIVQVTAGSLWRDMGISIFRVMTGFLIALVIAFPLGVIAGTFRFAEALMIPVTEFIRYMPVPAFIPLIMVWAGIGEMAKIMVIFLGTFVQMLLMVADNTRSVPQDLLHVSYTLGARRKQVVRHVLIPAMMPSLFDTLRLTIGWAWTYLIVAELVASNSGLGYRILKAQRFLETDVIFVGIFVIGLLGLITDRLFAIAKPRLFPWLEGGESR
ncbi:MAG: ABC transporter permease [Thermicanus sp.]|nr:ABC transporter permease [Thermicanus sp.]